MATAGARGFLGRHRRFLAALAAGLLAMLLSRLLPVPLAGTGRVLIGTNLFALAYLALSLRLALRVTPDDLRRHADSADEGMALILGLALAVVTVSLVAIFRSLTAPGGAGPLGVGLVLASVPLGWAMLHTVFAFHYAHLYYGPPGTEDRRGLNFTGTPQPGVWEFLYHAFTVGMTAQVSDVTVSRTGMRQLTLLHSALSFFYNTVILALAVNAALSLGR